MYAEVEKPKENKSGSIANSVAQKKSKGKQGFGFVDNRPEAIAQRKLQDTVNGDQANKTAASIIKDTVQRIGVDELRERGDKIRKADAGRIPKSGVNLWRMENQRENALIYVIGTAHGLNLSEMGKDQTARQYLIHFLQQEDFTHVYTEVAAQLPYVTFDDSLAEKLETRVRAKQELNEQFPEGEPNGTNRAERIAFLRKTQAVTNSNAGLQGIDGLGLDNAYATIARTRTRDRLTPVVGALETDDTRNAADAQNREDMGIVDDDAEHRLRRAPDEYIASNDSVIKGNQQDIFVEASEEMLAGRDIASAEQRNKQWMDRVKDMSLVNGGDRQLWIVGAAHLPGLILRFSELGWRPHHMDLPSV